jgi:AraC family transcriptional regulator
VSKLDNTSGNFNLVADLQSAQSEPLSGFSMVRWKVAENSVTYHNPDSHTLSLYLSGGQTSYRADHAGSKGSPGTLCLMPQGQDSQWHINGEIDFVHLYFSDEILQHYASTTLGADVRFIELKDLLYHQDSELKALFVEYVNLADERTMCSPLFAEQAMHKVLHHLLIHHNGFVVREHKIQGGLSPQHLRFIRDLIHQNLHQKLTIEMLSKEVDLSPFHFARMFKESFGESPANFVTRSRVEVVKFLLGTSRSLAVISSDTGFSHQSHMTNSFRKLVGLTPGAYRRRVMEMGSQSA